MKIKDIQVLKEGTLSIDVPNEDWLQDKIDYAKSKGRNSYGVPYMGSTTASVRGTPPRVRVMRLASLPGMRNEQSNVRRNDLKWLMDYMDKNKRLPPANNPNEEYLPYIMVAYNGEAWVNEGNHRIMAAYRLNWPDMPIEISYFDGGERIKDGAMYPGKIGLGEVDVPKTNEDLTEAESTGWTALEVVESILGKGRVTADEDELVQGMYYVYESNSPPAFEDTEELGQTGGAIRLHDLEATDPKAIAEAVHEACHAYAHSKSTSGMLYTNEKIINSLAEIWLKKNLSGANLHFALEHILSSKLHYGPDHMPRSVTEAFDKPYPVLRWETGDFGDVDAIARLDDNTFLSIMFNKGVSKDSKEEAWSVEFYRNNSQEVTGEGDSQRVFATVLSAIQTFIKKYTPNRITFSASKEVEPGQNTESRASLYDSLVQRYARSWGFRAFRADTGNKVIYELNRINKGVTEGSEHYDGIEISMEKEDDEIMVKAMMAGGRELGHVLFVIDGEYLAPQDLEVDERYQGQGIAATMYDYVKSKGYKIRRSGQQTDAGAGFWDKHKPGKNVWEQGMAEGKDFDRCFDQACKLYDQAVSKNLEPKLVQVADFQGDGNGADPRWMKLPQHVWQHYVVIVGDQVLDPTAKQFGDTMPTQYQVSDLDRLWGKQYQIRPRQGMAEGSLEELANTSLKVKEPKSFVNTNDRKQVTYKVMKFKSGKDTYLINFTVKGAPAFGKKQNWNAVNVSFGVREPQDDYSFGDEINTDLTARNKNQFLIYSTVINAVRKFITEYNTEIDEIIMQGAGERQEAMYQRFFQSAGKYFPGWHHDGKHSLVRDVPRQTGKKVREQGMAEARTNPDQNTRPASGMAELQAVAKTLGDIKNWAISMTAEPKLGINPQVGISEDTPKGIYFYPLDYALGMIQRRQPLPWGNNLPYIQLFQYDRSNEMTKGTRVDDARLKQALRQYCSDEVIQSAIDEPEYDGTPYWFIYDCLSRLGKSDETNVVRWNKVLRDLGFTSVYDDGHGWIAYNEPTQGVVLDPRIIKQLRTINNKKESGVITPALIEQTLFDNLDVELAGSRAWQAYDPDGSKLKQLCKEWAQSDDFKPWFGKDASALWDEDQKLMGLIGYYRRTVGREINNTAWEWYKEQQAQKTESITEGGDDGVTDLEQDLETPRSHDAIDHMMQTIAKEHGITAKQLHDMFVDKHGQVPDGWVNELAENFADGKNPQDKGDSQRHGIPKGATMAELEKAAKASGRKGQLARWQLNMRRGRKKATEGVIAEGGWASTETQNTVITPRTIAEIVHILDGFATSYNAWQAANELDAEIKIGKPKGSGTYYRRDLEQDPDREYGDVDVECFVHSRKGSGSAQRVTEYRRAIKDYCAQSPDFSTDNGTNIIMRTTAGPAQVDLIYTFHEHADWSRVLSPEYRVKGVISTSLTSSIAEALNLSFSSQGIQVKIRNNQPVSFRQSKDTELRTVSINPDNWAQDIYSLYYYLSHGEKPAEMPRDLQAHGGLKDEQRLSDIVLSIRALASGLEEANLLAHGALIDITDKKDLIRRVATIYSAKLEAAENSSKFDKAATPAAVEKAKKTKLMLAKYRNEVTKLLLN